MGKSKPLGYTEKNAGSGLQSNNVHSTGERNNTSLSLLYDTRKTPSPELTVGNQALC